MHDLVRGNAARLGFQLALQLLEGRWEAFRGRRRS